MPWCRGVPGPKIQPTSLETLLGPLDELPSDPVLVKSRTQEVLVVKTVERKILGVPTPQQESQIDVGELILEGVVNEDRERLRERVKRCRIAQMPAQVIERPIVLERHAMPPWTHARSACRPL